MKLISWNVAGRLEKLKKQVAALVEHEPDIVAIQEVTTRTLPLLKVELEEAGLRYSADSFVLANDKSVLTDARDDFLLIASRWPIQAMPPTEFNVPWPERVLSIILTRFEQSVEIHTTHIPPGVSHGWLKIDVLEGIYQRLAHQTNRLRILCGDFNTPLVEDPDGNVITCTTSIKKHPRWDAGCRNVILGLEKYDLPDVYRQLHGYAAQDFSWYWQRRNKHGGRRFDHIFASRSLNAIGCRYLHLLREQGLSDHSAIEAVFRLDHVQD